MSMQHNGYIRENGKMQGKLYYQSAGDDIEHDDIERTLVPRVAFRSYTSSR